MTEDNKLASLIAGCRQMNESSQLELYRLFYSYGMAICLRFTPNRESALETLNDGFLKAFLKIDQYDSNYSFKPWFRKILVNASIDQYRKYNKPNSNELWEVKKDSPSYNEALDHLEFEDLLKVMQLLPAGYRMVFNLYVVENLSHAEISERLNISIGTSKSNLSKARQKIKGLLSSSHDIHLKSEKDG